MVESFRSHQAVLTLLVGEEAVLFFSNSNLPEDVLASSMRQQGSFRAQVVVALLFLIARLTCNQLRSILCRRRPRRHCHHQSPSQMIFASWTFCRHRLHLHRRRKLLRPHKPGLRSPHLILTYLEVPTGQLPFQPHPAPGLRLRSQPLRYPTFGRSATPLYTVL